MSSLESRSPLESEVLILTQSSNRVDVRISKSGILYFTLKRNMIKVGQKLTEKIQQNKINH